MLARRQLKNNDSSNKHSQLINAREACSLNWVQCETEHPKPYSALGFPIRPFNFSMIHASLLLSAALHAAPVHASQIVAVPEYNHIHHANNRKHSSSQLIHGLTKRNPNIPQIEVELLHTLIAPGRKIADSLAETLKILERIIPQETAARFMHFQKDAESLRFVGKDDLEFLHVFLNRDFEITAETPRARQIISWIDKEAKDSGILNRLKIKDETELNQIISARESQILVHSPTENSQDFFGSDVKVFQDLSGDEIQYLHSYRSNSQPTEAMREEAQIIRNKLSIPVKSDILARFDTKNPDELNKFIEAAKISGEESLAEDMNLFVKVREQGLPNSLNLEQHLATMKLDPHENEMILNYVKSWTLSENSTPEKSQQVIAIMKRVFPELANDLTGIANQIEGYHKLSREEIAFLLNYLTNWKSIDDTPIEEAKEMVRIMQKLAPGFKGPQESFWTGNKIAVTSFVSGIGSVALWNFLGTSVPKLDASAPLLGQVSNSTLIALSPQITQVGTSAAIDSIAEPQIIEPTAALPANV